MGKYNALQTTVEMVQRVIAKVHGSTPVTILDAQQALKNAGHGNDAYRLARYWMNYGTKSVGWNDYGDTLRVAVPFKG